MDLRTQVYLIIQYIVFVIPFWTLVLLTFMCTTGNQFDNGHAECDNLYTALFWFLIAQMTVVQILAFVIFYVFIEKYHDKLVMTIETAMILIELGISYAYVFRIRTISTYDSETKRLYMVLVLLIFLGIAFSVRYIILPVARLCFKTDLKLKYKVSLKYQNKVIKQLKEHPIVKEYSIYHPSWNFVSSLIQKTWIYDLHRGHDAFNLEHDNIKVRQLYEICNGSLLVDYLNNAGHKEQTDSVRALMPSIMTLGVRNIPSTDAGHYTSLESAMYFQNKPRKLRPNEVYLFHGTPIKNTCNIIKNGFSIGKARRTTFGKGVYLAESSQKADQYSDRDWNRRQTNLTMFVVRTRLDNITEYSGEQCDKNKEKHTVLAGQHKRFREFVVKDKRNVYPEFLIVYDRI